MELLEQFGFDLRLFIAQIINFLVVLWVLKRYLYKPVLGVLKKREETIAQGLRNAEDAQKKLEEASKREKQILAKAQDVAKEILEDAKKQARNVLEKAEEETQLKTERMINEATVRIRQETLDAEQTLRTHASFIALEFLRKSIGELFEEKDQERILSKAIKRLQGEMN